MAGIPSHRLLLCISLLWNVFLVVAVLAEEGTPEKCKSNEELDAHGKCCTADLMDEKEEKKICFEEPSEMTTAVAFSLIGSFSFFVSLMFGVNWPRDRMRKHAYKMISSTVSIFCAVLMFQCINGLLEDLVVENFGLSNWSQFVLDAVHFIFWYTIMQVVIAVASGVTIPVDYRSGMLNEQITTAKKIAKEKQRVIIRCESFGAVLAHLTGFASINVWGSLQQKDLFNDSPFRALMPIGICVVAQMILQLITKRCRACVSLDDDNIKDWYEIQWDENCNEAEDDVMGLTMSVLFANVIRMAINGMNPIGLACIPNEEQEEEGEKCEEFIPKRSLAQVIWLFAVGYAFLIILFAVEWIHCRIQAEESHEESPKRKKHKSLSERIISLRNLVEKKQDKNVGGGDEEAEESFGAHALHVLMIALGMAFAWCIFHAQKQFFSVLNSSFLGDEANVCFTTVIVGLTVTYIGWISTWVLDQIQNLEDEYIPRSFDSSIKKVTDAISLLIGFAWEQTFDVSVGNLADSFRKDAGKHAPAIAKLFLATLCSGIAFMAWMWYILPFVVKEGWRFKFVFTAEDLLVAATALADDDPEVKEGVLPMLQSKYSDSREYKLLPGEAAFNMQERIILLEKLQNTEAENARLRGLLGENMQVMLGSLKALHTGSCTVDST